MLPFLKTSVSRRVTIAVERKYCEKKPRVLPAEDGGRRLVGKQARYNGLRNKFHLRKPRKEPYKTARREILSLERLREEGGS